MDCTNNKTAFTSITLIVLTLLLSACAGGLEESNTETPEPNTIPLKAQILKTQEDQSFQFEFEKKETKQFVLDAEPEHGILQGEFPVFTYTPNPDFHGEDSFSFSYEENGSLRRETIKVQIESINDAPQLNLSGVLAVNEDATLELTLDVSDIDSDEDDIMLRIETPAQLGVAELEGLTLRYVPHANLNGDDSIYIVTSDGISESEALRIDIHINPINDAPLALAIATVSVREDEQILLALNGSDVESNNLSVNIEQQPSNGFITIDENNRYYYQAKTNYFGQDEFSFSVSDGEANSEAQRVNLNILAVNDAPIANAYAEILVNEDNAIDFSPTGSDIENAELSFVISSNPNKGQLSLNNGQWVYTSNQDQTGIDQFAFRAFDGELYSDPVEVNITIVPVNDAPVVLPVADLQTNEDSKIIFDANVQDVDSSNVQLEIVKAPLQGEFTMVNGVFEYMPRSNYFGDDSFSFRAFDGELYSNEVNVQIHILAVNDAPVADPVATINIEEDSTYEFSPTAQDVENKSLSFEISTAPEHGQFVAVSEGFVYTPTQNYFGSDQFFYRAFDGTNYSEPVRVEIVISSVNDIPSTQAVNGDDQVVVDEDTQVQFQLSGSDIESLILQYDIVDLPNNGVITPTQTGYVYQANENYYGSDSFSFVATDEDNASSVPRTVSINVLPVNDRPIANNVVHDLDAGTRLDLTLSASDIDTLPGELVYTILTIPSHATLSGTAPNLSLVLDASYYGSDILRFQVSDGELTSQASVSLNIAPVATIDPSYGSLAYHANHQFHQGELFNLNFTPVAGSAGFSYLWEQTSGPLISNLQSDMASQWLRLSQAGLYEFQFQLSTTTSVVQSGTVYINVRDYTGQVLQISGDKKPSVISSNLRTSQFVTVGTARDIAVDNNHAFLVTSQGLATYDLSNPATPVKISQNTPSGDFRSIKLVNAHAYIAAGNAGLQVLDVTDPNAQQIYPSFALDTSAVDLDVSNGIAYVCTQSGSNQNGNTIAGKIHLIDISDTNNLNLIDSITSSNSCDRVYVNGNYLFLLESGSGVRIYELGTASPQLVSTINISGFLYGLLYHNNRLYVAGSSRGILVYDLSNPNIPSFSYEIPGSAFARDVLVFNNELLGIFQDEGVIRYDLSNPDQPSRIAQVPSTNHNTSRARVFFNNLYTMSSNKIATRFDLSNLSNATNSVIMPFTMINSDISTTYVYDAVMNGNTAYAITSDGTLRIYDISNPLSPTELSALGTSSTSSGPLKLTVHGNLVLHTIPFGNVAVIDVSNPLAPVQLSVLQIPNSVNANKPYVSGDLVYVYATVSGSTGNPYELHVFDISTPSAPVWKNAVSYSHSYGFMTGQGNHLYASVVGLGRLKAIDISSPTIPVDAQSIQWDGSKSLVIHNNYIYGDSLLNGLFVSSLSNPGFPSIASASKIHTYANYTTLDSMNNEIHLIDSFANINSFDVSVPNQPRFIQSQRLNYSTPKLYYHNNHFFAMQNQQLEILPRNRKILRIQNNYDVATPGQSLSYTLNWPVTPAPQGFEVKCWVSDGSCQVLTIISGIGEAIVEWQLPTLSGDAEIVIGAGNVNEFVTHTDRVSVVTNNP